MNLPEQYKMIKKKVSFFPQSISEWPGLPLSQNGDVVRKCKRYAQTQSFFAKLQEVAVWEHRLSSDAGLGTPDLAWTAAARKVVWVVSKVGACTGCANIHRYMPLQAAGCPVVPSLCCSTS